MKHALPKPASATDALEPALSTKTVEHHCG